MPLPVGKTLFTIVRYTLRPVNNLLITRFKQHGKAVSAESASFGFRFFHSIGQNANRFEVALNRILI